MHRSRVHARKAEIKTEHCEFARNTTISRFPVSPDNLYLEAGGEKSLRINARAASHQARALPR